MPKFLQPSLSGGELDPGLRGRVDLARYAISLGKARNFITKPTGGGAKRPGRYFRGRVKSPTGITRLIPFVYSTEVKYLIEMGVSYMRFWVNGALLTNSTKTITGITQANPAVVTSNAHGYSNGDYVILNNIAGMTELNGRHFQIAGVAANTYQLVGLDSTAFTAYASGGDGSRIVEVATPYTADKVQAVRYTQSADVLYLCHNQVPIKELRRLSVNSFELRDFSYRRGPFRSINTDEASIMAVSGISGVVTVTTNVDTFTSTMVGSLLYVEEKELRGVKPWASGEKNVGVGQLRRSDSKIYRVASVPTSLGGMGTPYYLTGASRPIHEIGRAFDGPQDVKNDGVNSYAVGVEWEFLHNVFGILKILVFTDARTVTAQVIERIPDSVVGTAPVPVAGPWALSGNGVGLSFSIPGATSPSYLNYRVTIDGVPVQANPSHPGGGGAGGCPDVDAILPGGKRAGDVKVDDWLQLGDPITLEPKIGKVTYSETKRARRFRIITKSGLSATCSDTAPIPTKEHGYKTPLQLAGHQIATRVGEAVNWDMVVGVVDLGLGDVQHIAVNNACFWIGDNEDGFILHHNAKPEFDL